MARSEERYMKLYFLSEACSLPCPIALLEAGIAHDLFKVDLRADSGHVV
jgi:hypothetical protein